MTVDFSELRQNMVDGQLRTTDVTDLGVLSAFLSVPREAFTPAQMRSLAYIDEDIEVASGRYLMEASPLAKLVQLAAISPDDVVLDVGCATGYSSAIMSRLASSVIAVESNETLAADAGEALAGLEYDNVVVLNDTLANGCAPEAPYDVIFVGGAVDFIPEALFDQLKNGGRLVTVEGTGNAARAMIYVKADDLVSGRAVFNCAIRPLPGFQRAQEFEF